MVILKTRPIHDLLANHDKTFTQLLIEDDYDWVLSEEFAAVRLLSVQEEFKTDMEISPLSGIFKTRGTRYHLN